MRTRLLIALLLLPIALPAFALGVGDYAVVSWKGQWYKTQVIDQRDAYFRIHYSGYDHRWDEWITPERMRIQVYWQGAWYNAQALEVSGSRVRIHYSGYDSSWDEWVTLDRVRSR